MTVSPQSSSPCETTRDRPSNERTESVMTIQGVPQSVQHNSSLEKGEDNSVPIETTMQSRLAHSRFAYPAWPTFQPGPEVTVPLPGQQPHPKRTDQMVYLCYDQERGKPCVPPTTTQSVQKQSTSISLPNDYFQEVVSEIEATKRWRAQGSMSEAEALERWLDDGGSPVAVFEPARRATTP
jgi:hypothetical protein